MRLKGRALQIQLLKDNRAFLVTVLAAFVILSFAVMYGGRLLYKVELREQHAKAASSLSQKKEIVFAFFSSLEEDLRFMRDISHTRDYVGTGLVSAHDKEEVLEVYRDFARHHRYISRIGIVDSSGREILSVAREGRLGSGVQGGFKEEWNFFREKVSGSGSFFITSHADTKLFSEPVIRFAAPLLTARGELKGILIMDARFSNLLDLLSRNTHVLTDEGFSIYRKSDGTVTGEKSPYTFNGNEGYRVVTDEDIVYFSTLSLSTGKKWVLFFTESQASLKATLLRVMLASLVFLAIFFLLTLGISYITIKNHRDIESSQKAIIFSLANLAEWRDPETGYHLERTRNYGVILARQLGNTPKYRDIIDERFIDDLYNAAPLHDIGTVGIRDGVLLKEGKLSPDEFEEIKRHVHIGRDILKDVIEEFSIERSFFIMSKNIAGSHHEKYNGKGYPDGLSDDEIPLEARIYALCDAYDAIRAKRPYKEPVAHEEAVRRIRLDRGEHFDPDVVDAFLACEKELMEVYEAYRFFVEKYNESSDSGKRRNMAIQWDESLAVGIDEIDDQHRELILRINRLFEAILKGKGKEEVSRTVSFLEEYAVMHFGREEEYMLRCDYPDYPAHLAQHVQFVQTLSGLRRKFETEGTSSELVIALNRNVVNWLINHIKKTDRGTGAFLIGKL